jgi:opacity protein-like surface antigen
MKHRLSGITLALLMLAGASFAQVVYSSPNGPYNHGEVGAFFNYTLLHNANNTSFYGLGGRVGFNLSPSSSRKLEKWRF